MIAKTIAMKNAKKAAARLIDIDVFTAPTCWLH
jgi:hypothetical protein